MYQFFFVKKHLGGLGWTVPFAVYFPFYFFFLVSVRPLIFRRHQEIHLAYSPRIVTAPRSDNACQTRYVYFKFNQRVILHVSKYCVLNQRGSF